MTPLHLRNNWIFDLDGTLTVPVHDFDHIRRELDVPQDADILSYISAIPDPSERQRKSQHLDEMEFYYAGFTQPAEGVLELLQALNKRGVQLGILTRNTKAIAWHSLQAIQAEHYFSQENILGRDECAPKPDPAGIQWLLERWQQSPEKSVMVGDYRHDLAAGRAAGVATVYIDHGVHVGWPELADYSVSSLKQLQSLLI